MSASRLPPVPGAVPVDSILGSSYEQQISLSWREPLQTYGLIRKYEVKLDIIVQHADVNYF